jgi:transposase-like protein
MKRLALTNNCPTSKNSHEFELFVLESLDVLFKCKNCKYEYTDIVEKPDWLLSQKKDLLKKHFKE